LRHLALDRLARVDYALTADRFFRAKLAEEWAASPSFDDDFQTAAPVILLPVSLENPNSEKTVRTSHVDLIGGDERFWQLGDGGPKQSPRAHEVALNQPLAEQLGVQRGDTVLLRLPRINTVPADSAFGDKQDTVVTQRLTVSDVLPAEGLGHFRLRPTQHLAYNAYVSLEWLADQLKQPGGANAILIGLRKDRENDTAKPYRRPNSKHGCTRRSPILDGMWNYRREAMSTLRPIECC